MKKNLFFVLLLLFSCKKPANLTSATVSSGISEEGGITYFNLSKDGLNIRSAPNPDGNVLGVIPHNATVKFLEKGPASEVNGVWDFWYKIIFGKVTGWVFARHLTTAPPGFDFQKFSGGCLGDECYACGAVRFQPGGVVDAAISCHYGHGEGKWRSEKTAIIAEIQYFPSCYDSCLPESDPKAEETPKFAKEYQAAAEKYVNDNKYKVELRFSQKPNGEMDYTLLSSSRPVSAEYELPKRPLGFMRHFEPKK